MADVWVSLWDGKSVEWMADLMDVELADYVAAKMVAKTVYVMVVRWVVLKVCETAGNSDERLVASTETMRVALKAATKEWT